MKKARNKYTAASKSLKETVGAYRFFDNEKVKLEKILEPHVDAALERIKSHKVVLLIQDTESIQLRE